MNQNTDKPRCQNGHEFSEENTHVKKNGWRVCRTCARAYNQALKEARRAKVDQLSEVERAKLISRDYIKARVRSCLSPLSIKGDCLAWIGAKGSNGYGLITFYGRVISAHKVAWLLEKGEIPKGLVLDHLCRNRACVNPDHLEPVTQQINVNRGARVQRQLRESG